MLESRDRSGISIVRTVMLLATAGLSLLNGMTFSPLFDPVFFLMRPFAPAVLSYAPMLLFYFTSLLISLVTLLLAGVPAAIYERGRGLQHSTSASLGIWLAATLLLALPGLMTVAGRD